MGPGLATRARLWHLPVLQDTPGKSFPTHYFAFATAQQPGKGLEASWHFLAKEFLASDILPPLPAQCGEGRQVLLQPEGLSNRKLPQGFQDVVPGNGVPGTWLLPPAPGSPKGSSLPAPGSCIPLVAPCSPFSLTSCQLLCVATNF